MMDRATPTNPVPTPVAGLVTTIIPVYNRPKMLVEAVESVLAQTYRPIEVIIVDDGSTDVTPDVADGLQRAHPETISVLTKTNAGPGAARELGRRAARGEFIQYLDSDDLLLPRKFEWQVAGLAEHPECDVSYGKTRHYKGGEAPRDVAYKRTGEVFETILPSMLMSRWWSTSTPLFRRRIVDTAGPWTSLKNEEDWEYDVRVASYGAQLHFCPEFVSDTRWHDGGQLSDHGSIDRDKLRDRATAHDLIFSHAKRAGIDVDCTEMKHFARELFLLARQCGNAGLVPEARKLFGLAREASGPDRAQGIDFVLYRAVAGSIGWDRAGRLASKLDRLRL